jgi:hypothetical protein
VRIRRQAAPALAPHPSGACGVVLRYSAYREQVREMFGRWITTKPSRREVLPRLIAPPAGGANLGTNFSQGQLVRRPDSNLLLRLYLPSFIAPLSYDTSGAPLSVSMGDFTGDGLLDLAVTNVGRDGVRVAEAGLWRRGPKPVGAHGSNRRGSRRRASGRFCL